MAGSAARRYMVTRETEDHVNKSERVAQIASQIILDAVSPPPAPKEVHLPHEEAPPELLEPAGRAQAMSGADLAARGRAMSDSDAYEASHAELVRAYRPSNTAAAMEGMNGTAGADALLPPLGGNVVQMPGTQRQNSAQSKNITDQLKDSHIAEIAVEVKRGYDIDRGSLSGWLGGVEDAVDLIDLHARPTAEHMLTPGAANVKFPLIQLAVQDFANRSSQAILRPRDLVKMRVEGNEAESDPQMEAEAQQLMTDLRSGQLTASDINPQQLMMLQQRILRSQKTERAARVGRYMSYQLRTELKGWLDDTDLLLHMVPLYGTVFTKTYFSITMQRIVRELCDPRRVIINRSTPSMERVTRITECFIKYPHEVQSLIRSGEWRDVYDTVVEGKLGEDSQQPIEFIEQHCRIDLDGDGYDEPLRIIMDADCMEVCAVYLNFEEGEVTFGPQGEIIEIKPADIFTAYKFLPDADKGGIYALGYAHLLFDHAHTVNSITRQMMDAAMLQNNSGGLIGKGLRFGRSEQGDQMHLAKNRYHYVSSTGAAIREQIYEFQHSGPSQSMFELLSMVISSAKEIAGIDDVLRDMSGHSNMPVGTVLALIEQGMVPFNAFFGRLYRALSHEFGLLYSLNGRYAKVQMPRYSNFIDDDKATDEDFEQDRADITPTADPKAVTDVQKIGKAQLVLQVGQNNPLFDQRKLYGHVLEAAGIENYERLFATRDIEAAQRQTLMQDLAIKKAVEELLHERAGTRLKYAQAHERTSEAAAHQANAETVPKQIDMQERELAHTIEMDRRELGLESDKSIRFKPDPQIPSRRRITAFGTDPNTQL